MNYTQVTSPSWNKNHDKIDCMVTFDALGTVPFSADPSDPNPWCSEIYNRCLAGEFGPIAEYVPYIDEGENPQATATMPQIPVTNTGEIL